ncbi:MAG: hemin receptor, partial [Solirubrobacteraceae bacterium]
MTPDQVRLVRESWAQVKPIAPTAAGLFYGRLFEIEPSVRPLFKRDIGEQGVMLMGMIGMVVARLDDLTELVPA